MEKFINSTNKSEIDKLNEELPLTNNNTLNRTEIDKILKEAADLIRTRIDYKFILVLLFLKRISDKWELENQKAYAKLIKEGVSKEKAKEMAKKPMFHDFDFSEKYIWNNIRKDVDELPENFSKALKKISELNPELKDIMERFEFIQFTSDRENSEILRQLVELFSSKKLDYVSADILGDAYEWLLKYFAPQKAKEGEVYTPREVINLLVKILDPQPGQSVYDPASASNGMLISAYQHLKKEDAEKLFLYGQEYNPDTLALGKMNLYIHNIRNAEIEKGNTLLYPKFKEGASFKQFDIVIANPPWNQDGYPEETLKKGEYWKKRYEYGFVNKNSADWAWIQHMVASAKDTGRVGVVIDNGCLFRGSKEKAIRTKVIEKDLIECVILLPEKLFYNTGAPGAIIILNKNKKENRKDKILFVNASGESEQHPDVKKLRILGDNHIKRIANAYNDFKDNDGFAQIISKEEIAENDYNLNVSLYAFPPMEVEEIDIATEWEELKKLNIELGAIEEQIESHLKEVE